MRPVLVKRRDHDKRIPVLLLSGFAISALTACKLEGRSHLDNFVSMKGGAPQSLVLSMSQEEAKVGMYRLCRGPDGTKFAGYEKCRQIVRDFETKNLPKFEEAASGGDTEPVDESLLDASSQVSTSDNSPSFNLNLPADFTDLSDGDKEEGETPPQLFLNTSADIEGPEKIEIKKVEDPLKSGDHSTPRCWYRYDTKDGLFPDIYSEDGRSSTFRASQRLTTYSVKSQTIVEAMRADNRLKRIALNVYDPDVLYGQKYNENLENLLKASIFVMLTDAMKTKIGALEEKAFRTWVQHAWVKSGRFFDSIGQGLAMLSAGRFKGGIASTQPLNQSAIASARNASKRAWKAYEFCFKGNALALTFCTGAVISAFNGIVKLGVGGFTSLQIQTPKLIDMEAKDLETAINMIASSKTNIELTQDDFEKLAYIPPRDGTKVGGWFGFGEKLRDIGIIPRLGDKSGTNFLCPSEQVASQIMKFSPLTLDQYKQISAEFDQKIGVSSSSSPSNE